jgi:hypothetical protein
MDAHVDYWLSTRATLQGDPGTVFDKSSLLAERVAEVNG